MRSLASKFIKSLKKWRLLLRLRRHVLYFCAIQHNAAPLRGLCAGDRVGAQQAGGQGVRQGPRTHHQRQPGWIRRIQVRYSQGFFIAFSCDLNWSLSLFYLDSRENLNGFLLFQLD